MEQFSFGGTIDFFGEANSGIGFVIVVYGYVDINEVFHEITNTQTSPGMQSDMKYYFGGAIASADRYWDEDEGGYYFIRARWYVNRDAWLANPNSFVTSEGFSLIMVE